jgi:hypothetical protein
MDEGFVRVLYRDRDYFTLVNFLNDKEVTESFTVHDMVEARKAVSRLRANYDNGKPWKPMGKNNNPGMFAPVTNEAVVIGTARLPWKGDSLPAMAPKGALWVCVLR